MTKATKMSGHFLCKEHGEPFIVEAKDMRQAQRDASMYGGEAIRELSQDEYSSGKIPEIIAYEAENGGDDEN